MRLYFIFLCILGISLSSCTSNRMNFDFYDSTGRKYNSLTFSDQLFVDNNQSVILVLIETNQAKSIDFQNQLKILENLPAELLNLIYVTSNTVVEDRLGYHTTISTAKQLSVDHNGFQISLMSSKGKILKRSNDILNADDIKRIIREMNTK